MPNIVYNLHIMFDANNLHHAYVIEGNIDNSLNMVRNFLKKELKVNLKGNIDLFERVYESFGIADAREIKDLMVDKSLGKYRIFILGIPSMTTQSGNALLKSIEEPPKGTHFFIAVPNAKRLLPTLLSRVVLLQSKEKSLNNSGIGQILDPKNFLKLSSEKRLDEVKKVLDLYDKEKISKQYIIYFMNDLIREYRHKKDLNIKNLERAITAIDYAGDPSSSLKIILEYISLILK